MMAQPWVKTGATFHYKVHYKVWDNNDGILKVDSIKDFAIKIDSVIKKKKAVFFFIDNYFEMSINDDNKHGFYAGKRKTCIAIYKHVLYELYYPEIKKYMTTIDFEKILRNKYPGVRYNKKINLVPNLADSNEYTTHRFDNELDLNEQEKEAFFVKRYKMGGKFGGMVNLYRAVDGKGYFDDTLVYSNQYFFTNYHRNVSRSSTPYSIELELIKINYKPGVIILANKQKHNRRNASD